MVMLKEFEKRYVSLYGEKESIKYCGCGHISIGFRGKFLEKSSVFFEKEIAKNVRGLMSFSYDFRSGSR